MIILDAPDKPGIRRADLKSHKVAFKRRHPLVVLNACDTAALEPDKAITLVEGFTYYGASAVIGTEITVFAGLAYAFGSKFLDAFVGGSSLGAAVRQARLDLLRRWNPLGLAYVAYGLYDLRLAGNAGEQAVA
jgi:CHAT domain-containing protein